MAPETAATRPARKGPRFRHARPWRRLGDGVEVREVGAAMAPRIARRAKDVRLTISETLGLGMWRHVNYTDDEEGALGGVCVHPGARPQGEPTRMRLSGALPCAARCP